VLRVAATDETDGEADGTERQSTAAEADGTERQSTAAEADGTLVGFAEAELAEGRGEVRWLHIDPEHRGRGAGTALFEAVREALDERGARHLYASSLADNNGGGEFFERVGFERTDDREVDLGGEELVEHVYVEASTDDDAGPESQGQDGADDAGGGESGDADGETADPPNKAGTPAQEEAQAAPDDDDGPGTPDETEVTDGEGRSLRVGEDGLSGTEGAFFPTYGADDGERYGFYCDNCGSTDVDANEADRLICESCGNRHESGEEYDAAYL
jgi:N-acetylglutamate synthase-like GNAT family acetyltransferase/ribosomal protein S27AE